MRKPRSTCEVITCDDMQQKVPEADVCVIEFVQSVRCALKCPATRSIDFIVPVYDWQASHLSHVWQQV
jgi:hypothetical protein